MTLRFALPVLFAAGLTACSDAPPRYDDPYRDALVVDASRDASARDAAATDGSSDAASADAGDAGDASVVDASVDAGLLPPCTVASTRTVVTTSTSASIVPSLVANGTNAVVAWVETRLAEPNVFERLVPSSGALGTERQLTADAYLEADLAIAPTGSDYVLGYARTVGASVDVATLAFESSTGSLLGVNDLTNDLATDGSPAFIASSAGGFIVFYERSNPSAEVLRQETSSNGTPITAAASVSTTRTITRPYVVDATTGDVRIFHVATTSSVESVRLDANGAETTPDAHVTTVSAPATIGTRLRTTEPNASPRVFLASATRSARATAYVQRLSSSGASLGAFTEVDTRTITAPAIATHAGVAIVAYRTTDASGPEVRLRGFDDTGALVLDHTLVLTASASGELAMVALSNGTLVVVLDDAVAAGRELRALRVDCPF